MTNGRTQFSGTASVRLVGIGADQLAKGIGRGLEIAVTSILDPHQTRPRRRREDRARIVLGIASTRLPGQTNQRLIQVTRGTLADPLGIDQIQGHHAQGMRVIASRHQRRQRTG